MLTINPDNFIFHSDFWYPQSPIKGTVPLSGVNLPTTVKVASGIEDGDIYFAFTDDSMITGIRVITQPTRFGRVFVKDGDLYVTIGPGPQYTGVIRYYIYKKKGSFLFNTLDGADRALFRSSGTLTTGGSGTGIKDIPLERPMRLFGIYKRTTDSDWRVFNEQMPGGVGELMWMAQSGGIARVQVIGMTSAEVQYRIVGMPI